MLDLSNVRNPAIDHGASVALRDPALLCHDGELWCFYTIASPQDNAYKLSVGVSRSRDMKTWSSQCVIPDSPLNFSSPGNVLRIGSEWIMCIQSYPVDPGNVWGNENSRLWLVRSGDLISWSQPEPIQPDGCLGAWTTSKRQIDPYLVEYAGQYWCFYKNSGQIGALISNDLLTWTEADPKKPVLSSRDTPDGATLENPCIVTTDEGFAMFFSPCRKGRGIGVAYSEDLLRWQDVHYVDFPAMPWADAGVTAAMVLDLRRELNVWLMGFHGERSDEKNAHSAAIGFAWSTDMKTWESIRKADNLLQATT